MPRSIVQALTCIALSTTLLGVPPASADTFHVAPPPSGDDGNAGTLGAPWATLQHAANSVSPGDTVLVHTGGYTGFHLTTSGTAGQRITFAAAQGETPEIVADNGVTIDGINLEGTDYVTVEGFTVNDRGRAGIRAVLCDEVILRNNITHSNDRWGIFTGFCDDLLIEGNVTSGSHVEHGIYVSNSGDRPVIRGNWIYDNNANGIHMNGDISQGGDGIISDAVVEKNVIFGNGTAGGSGINCDGVQDSLIRNNLIFDQHASGISLYQIDGAAGSSGNRLYNNTIHVASDGRWALNIQNASINNTVKNNTLWSDHGFRGAIDISLDSLPGLISDLNAMEDRVTTDGGNSTLTLDQWQSNHSQDANSFVAAPAVLYAAAGSDYHHHPDSPAIDTGETLADVPDDLEGNPRPDGLAYDIGAYEGFGIFADGFESGDTTAW